MTRDEYLAEVDRAIAPVTDLLLAGRMGVEKAFNPLMVQISLETAKVLSLAAIAASGMAVSGEVLELAVDGANLEPVQQPPAPPVNGSGLIVPG